MRSTKKVNSNKWTIISQLDFSLINFSLFSKKSKRLAFAKEPLITKLRVLLCVGISNLSVDVSYIGLGFGDKTIGKTN